eukprot:scaffold94896_cov69-Phaeocystis_antarctica.AAC.3
MCAGGGPSTAACAASTSAIDGPWKMGRPNNSSATMQPTPHTSTLPSHGRPSITSGARYQRDCTYELWQSHCITAEPKSMI